MNQETSTRQSIDPESSRIGINLIALAVARFISMAMALVQAGIIFRILTVEGAGQYGFAFGYTSLFTVFATLGIQRLLMRDISRDYRIAWTYTWTALATVTVLSAVAFGIIAGSILIFEENAQTRSAVLMAGLWVVVLWALQRPLEGLLMAKERMVLVAVVYVVGGLLRLVAVYLFVHHTPTSAAAHAAIAAANLAALLLCFLLCLYAAGWERPKVRLALVLHQIRECLPFVCAMVCSLIYFKSDIAILKFILGEESVGIYTPTLRITEPILMIAGLWGTAIFPAFCRFSQTAPERHAKLTKTSLRLALLVAFPMALGIALLAEPIIGLLTGERATEYGESVVLLRMLCVMMPLFYFNGIGQETLYSEHRNWVVVGCYAVAAVVSVLGNVICIPVFGLRAVPAVAIVANLSVTVSFLYFMHSKSSPLRLTQFIGKTLIACAAMGFCVYLTRGVNLPAGVALGAMVYLGAQLLLKTLDEEERALARGIAVQIAQRFRGV